MKERKREKTNHDLISIVVPVYNEEDNIHAMVDEIIRHLPDEKFEILFIDDGSSDGTLQHLRKLAEQYSFVTYFSFSRNFGHQNAIKAGFDFANGDCVITIDGDLQHPVELIPQLIALWRQGADVVHTKRRIDHKLSFFKKATAVLYYFLFKLFANVNIEPGMADFRLISRPVVDLCKQSMEENFFWRGFIPWLGFRQEILDYKPNPRLRGTTKYTIRKMFKLAWSGISGFSMMPLRFAIFLGAFGLMSSGVYFLYVIFLYVTGATVPGWSSLMVMMLFLGSIQLITIGIIGEYIGKIFMNTKQRPRYIVKEYGKASGNLNK